MSTSTRFWTLTLLGVSAVVGLVLTITSNAFAQAQPQLTSKYVKTGLPTTDPADPAWQQAPLVEVPLTPQQATVPMLMQGTIPAMQVRSMNDGTWIAFRLEWNDATQDELTVAQDRFRDAVAIQLPVNPSIPGVCMGVRGQPVNLWHWKADWQADIDSGFKDLVAAYPNFWKDYYPFAVGTPPFKTPADFSDPDARRYLVGWSVGNPLSEQARVTPVEELLAHGFGTATTRSQQGVLGRGQWTQGRWSVVFARPLTTADPTATQLTAGQRAFIAVAAWNGSNQEVGARKQISADIAMLIEQPAPEQSVAPIVLPPPVEKTAVEKFWWIGFVGGAALLLAGAVVLGHLLGRQGTGRPGGDLDRGGQSQPGTG